MGRTYRRGESFLLARHGRRSMVRPQVRSGCAVFSVGFVLAIWAITTIRRAGTRVETNKPTTAIVENGPYRFTRATRSTSVCSLFYFVIRFSVIARQV
jgi:hypothetical protein